MILRISQRVITSCYYSYLWKMAERLPQILNSVNKKTQDSLGFDKCEINRQNKKISMDSTGRRMQKKQMKSDGHEEINFTKLFT